MYINRHSFGETMTAAAVVLGLLATPALAQDNQTQDNQQTQTQQSGNQQSGSKQPQAGQATDTQSGSDQSQNAQQGQDQPDSVLAKVGEAEIRTSDVDAVIAGLPAPVRQQPPQLLVPLAVDQLVLRELILQEAEAENLGEDPEVQQMVDASSEAAREDAMVNVWIAREMDKRVTDDAVQQVYKDLQQASEGEELPPVDQLRPQIEQYLSQQAVAEIGTTLKEDAEITLYGPDGKPLADQTETQ